jgi:hypothetical protein
VQEVQEPKYQPKQNADSGEFNLNAHGNEKAETLKLGEQSTNRSVDDFRYPDNVMKPRINEYGEDTETQHKDNEHIRLSMHSRHDSIQTEVGAKSPVIKVKVSSGQSKPFTKIVSNNHKSREHAATSYDNKPA